MEEKKKNEIIEFLEEALEEEFEYGFIKLGDIVNIENAITIRHKVQKEKVMIVPIYNDGTIEDFKEEFEIRMEMLKRKLFKYNKNYKPLA